jgi:hypothetical protein
LTPYPSAKNLSSAGLGVHEYDIRIASTARVQRLTGALRHHLNINAGLGLKQRQDVTEQA